MAIGFSFLVTFIVTALICTVIMKVRAKKMDKGDVVMTDSSNKL